MSLVASSSGVRMSSALTKLDASAHAVRFVSSTFPVMRFPFLLEAATMGPHSEATARWWRTRNRDMEYVELLTAARPM